MIAIIVTCADPAGVETPPDATPWIKGDDNLFYARWIVADSYQIPEGVTQIGTGHAPQQIGTAIVTDMAGEEIGTQAIMLPQFAGWEEPALSPAQIQKQLTDAVQLHLDAIAQARGYDGILSAASYAGSTHARFGADGIAARDWRDAVWDYGNQVLADCKEGKRSIPAKKELIEELPPMEWPI